MKEITMSLNRQKSEVSSMSEEVEIVQNNDYSDQAYLDLLKGVGTALNRGRQTIASALNSAMIHTYWEIGRDIVKFEQKGHIKAEYGTELFKRLSGDLTERYGKGFSHSMNMFACIIKMWHSCFPAFSQVYDYFTRGRYAYAEYLFW